MVNSVEIPEKFGSGVAEIEQISIRWCCIAEDTMIRMADGCQKQIKDIEIGEKIQNTAGEGIAIVNSLEGSEKTLIELTTFNGYTLRMTDTHSGLTERGFVKASEINAADMIITEKGSTQVKFIFPISYAKQVYSLMFETPQQFYCNGIATGDFSIQNSGFSERKKKPTRTLLQEELINLVKEKLN